MDNRRENLRVLTKADNLRSKRRRSDASTKYKGVYWHNARPGKGRGGWRARITAYGKKHDLGQYPDIDDAARAYNRGARDFLGELAVYNEVDPLFDAQPKKPTTPKPKPEGRIPSDFRKRDR